MNRSPAQIAHLNSVSFQEARKTGLVRALEVRQNGPKCGAKKRSGSGTCKQPVTESGKRCRYHGGATPKGNEWHRRQWPTKGTSESRLKVKLKSLELRDREAEARRAEMTPEQREAHEDRRRAMRPASLTERAARKQAREAQRFIQKPKESNSGCSEKVAALGSEIEKLETKARELAARGLQAEAPDDEGDVFK